MSESNLRAYFGFELKKILEEHEGKLVSDRILNEINNQLDELRNKLKSNEFAIPIDLLKLAARTSPGDKTKIIMYYAS